MYQKKKKIFFIVGISFFFCIIFVVLFSFTNLANLFKDYKVLALQKDLTTMKNALILYEESENKNLLEFAEKIDKDDLSQEVKNELKMNNYNSNDIYKIDFEKIKPYISDLEYDKENYYYYATSNSIISLEGKKDSNNNMHYSIDEESLFNNSDGIDIKEFGAIGDGITDDTKAIQKAFNSKYKNIKISKGTYLISKSLSIPSNKTIIGEGKNSIIKLVGNNKDVNMLNALCEKNITLKNFQVDANKENFTRKNSRTTGLYFENCNNIKINEMYVRGALIEGVYFYKTSNIKINNLYSYEHGLYRKDASGLHIDTCNNAIIKNSLLSNNGFHGLFLSSTRNSEITGIVSKNNGWDGLRLQYDSNCNIFKNINSSNNTRGIYFTTNSNNNKILESTYDNNTFNGITLNESKYNVLDGVSSLNNNEYGLYFVNPTDNIINKNIFFLNNSLGDIYYDNESQIIN